MDQQEPKAPPEGTAPEGSQPLVEGDQQDDNVLAQERTPLPVEPSSPEEALGPEETEAATVEGGEPLLDASPPAPEAVDAEEEEIDDIDDEANLIFLDDDEDLSPVLTAAGVLPKKGGCLGKALILFLVLALLGGGGFALFHFVLRDRFFPPPTPSPTEPPAPSAEETLVDKTPTMLRQRRASLRRKTALAYGGSETSEKAVDSALAYLEREASAEGGWRSKAYRPSSGKSIDLALTGLCLLAFAGAGQTASYGDHKEVVTKALEWVLSSQDPKTGRIYRPGKGHHGKPGYTHAICGLALAEMAALDQEDRFIDAAKKAVHYAVNVHQYNKRKRRGGWRYLPNAHWGDTSVTGWYMMLLKVAPKAGVEVPAEAIDGAVAFLESCRMNKDDGQGNRLHFYGYTNSADITPRRSVLGCLCRLYADTTALDLAPSLRRITKKRPPLWDRQDWYYWYYGMLLSFQVDRANVFKTWNLALRDAIVKAQSHEGSTAGSWDPRGEYGMFGRIFTTSMAALILEVYYRYAPKEPGGS